MVFCALGSFGFSWRAAELVFRCSVNVLPVVNTDSTVRRAREHPVQAPTQAIDLSRCWSEVDTIDS